jgi:hypothetical protein
VPRVAGRRDDGAAAVDAAVRKAGARHRWHGAAPGDWDPQGGTGAPIRARCSCDVRDLWWDNGHTALERKRTCAETRMMACVGVKNRQRQHGSVVLGQPEHCGRALSAATTEHPCSRDRHAGKPAASCCRVAWRWGRIARGSSPHAPARLARTSVCPGRCTVWCQEQHHRRLSVRCQRLHATLRGASHSSGGHGHAASRHEGFTSAMRMLLQWRTRRRQRHRDTWHGDTDVRERWQVARPRSGGRPKTRQAVLKAEADLRQRVLLKSPVRDHRTPGSVRGRLGNWQSYRDGLRTSTEKIRTNSHTKVVILKMLRLR